MLLTIRLSLTHLTNCKKKTYLATLVDRLFNFIRMIDKTIAAKRENQQVATDNKEEKGCKKQFKN